MNLEDNRTLRPKRKRAVRVVISSPEESSPNAEMTAVCPLFNHHDYRLNLFGKGLLRLRRSFAQFRLSSQLAQQEQEEEVVVEEEKEEEEEEEGNEGE
ncbi:UNVERIFIED_CONTAM: hypothetical protein K2H54_054429 [Gekko kuhli]